MEITNELIETIYKRANQYSKAKWGNEPDEIRICDTGELVAIYRDYCCGSVEVDEEYFCAQDLTADLDAVYAERMRLREEQRKKEEEYRLKIEEENKIRQKAERHAQYLKLKQEFDI